MYDVNNSAHGLCENLKSSPSFLSAPVVIHHCRHTHHHHRCIIIIMDVLRYGSRIDAQSSDAMSGALAMENQQVMMVKRTKMTKKILTMMILMMMMKNKMVLMMKKNMVTMINDQ